MASLADAHQPVAAVAGEIEVEVVAVVGIVVGAEHGGEIVGMRRHAPRAGTGARAGAVPALFDGQPGAVGQDESGDVERVGAAVLAELGARTWLFIGRQE